MSGFGRRKNPSDTDEQMPDEQTVYMKAAGLTPVEPESKPNKKKKVRLDPGGQLYRGEDRQA